MERDTWSSYAKNAREGIMREGRGDYLMQRGTIPRILQYFSFTYYLLVGNFQDNLIARFLESDISRHLISVILDNFFIPNHLIFPDFLSRIPHTDELTHKVAVWV